jgi:hypothetical protein
MICEISYNHAKEDQNIEMNYKITFPEPRRKVLVVYLCRGNLIYKIGCMKLASSKTELVHNLLCEDGCIYLKAVYCLKKLATLEIRFFLSFCFISH